MSGVERPLCFLGRCFFGASQLARWKREAYLSVAWIAEIDHVLEACGRGGVSVITHEICIYNIPSSSLFPFAVSS